MQGFEYTFLKDTQMANKNIKNQYSLGKCKVKTTMPYSFEGN